MSDDQNTLQNPTPDPTSQPTSPQPSVEQAPKITPITEAPTMPPEAPEASRDGAMPESNNIPPSIEEPLEEKEVKPLENQASTIPAPVEPEPAVPQSGTAQPQTSSAQMGGNEPLAHFAHSSKLKEILAKGIRVIQFRKQKKLEKILTLFTKRISITNNDVQKLLHVSDATATRYLSILEKEGKIKQEKKTGQSVFYTKI